MKKGRVDVVTMINQIPIAESKDFAIKKLEEEQQKLRASLITLRKKVQDLEREKADLENELKLATETIQHLREIHPEETTRKIRYHTMCEIDQEETIKKEYIDYLEKKISQIEGSTKTD